MTDNQDHAQAWAAAITSDTDAVLALFADALVYDDKRNNDHVTDTAITKEELRPKVAPFANTDKDNGLGIHHFEVPRRSTREATTVLAPSPSCGSGPRRISRTTGAFLTRARAPAPGDRPGTSSTATAWWTGSRPSGTTSRSSRSWASLPSHRATGKPISTPARWAERSETCYLRAGLSGCVSRSSPRP